MRDRMIGSVESAWQLLEFRNVPISNTVTPCTIHLENKRNVLICNESLRRTLRDTELKSYFCKARKIQELLVPVLHEESRNGE